MELPTIYSKYVTSAVGNMEQLLFDIDQNGVIIADESMLASFRNMSKTMQRILSKYDKRKQSVEERASTNASPEEQISEQISKNSPEKRHSEVLQPSIGLFDEGFLYNTVISSGSNIGTKSNGILERSRSFAEALEKRFKIDIDDSDSGEDEMELIHPPDHTPKPTINGKETCFMQTSKNGDKMETSITYSNGIESCSSPTTPCPKKNEAKTETSTTSRPSRNHSCTEETEFNDAALEKISYLTYFCKVCQIELNRNSVQPHLNGQKHKKNNRSVSQEIPSCDRKLSISPLNENDYAAIEGVKRELRENEDGNNYIVTRNSVSNFYYCNLCRVEIAKYNTNLIQHLTGQQHKRLCKSD